MDAYKQWHTENPVVFNSEQNVYFSQCTKNKTLSINELLKITSDLAVEDFNQRGMSREKMLENNFMILVSRNSFHFHKMPVENQHITVSTWEEKNEPLQFIRAYEIKDTRTEEKLVSGLSSWLLVSAKERKLLPVKLFNLRQPVEYESEHECLKLIKIPEKENMEFIGEHKIGFSDLDANGHTNNSRYAAFLFDALPQEFQNKNFKDFRINYSKEAMIGETVKLYAAFEENKITVVGKTDSISFESELYF